MTDGPLPVEGSDAEFAPPLGRAAALAALHAERVDLKVEVMSPLGELTFGGSQPR